MSLAAVDILVRDCRCLPVEKLVLISIASRGKGTNGRDGFPGINTIAAETGLGRSTVIRTLGAMRDKGWITWIPGDITKNAVNTYTIHFAAIPKKQHKPSGAVPLEPSPAVGLGNRRDLVPLTHKPSPGAGPEALTEASTRRRAYAAPPVSKKPCLRSNGAAPSQRLTSTAGKRKTSPGQMPTTRELNEDI